MPKGEMEGKMEVSVLELLSLQKSSFGSAFGSLEILLWWG